MNKTLKALFLLLVAFAFAANAYAALPTLDGTLGVGEWNNNSYSFYLEAFDVNEAGISDAYDIKHVVLFQEYNAIITPQDGIYLLLENFATPSLVDSGAGDPAASVSMNADFNGDGFVDLIITHKAEFGPDTFTFKRPLGSIFGPVADTACVGCVVAKGSVFEYFIPSGTGGTPHAPFPGSFIGTIVFDNGGDEADDRITGQNVAVPEPGTFFLLGTGLLSMLGFGKFGKK